MLLCVASTLPDRSRDVAADDALEMGLEACHESGSMIRGRGTFEVLSDGRPRRDIHTIWRAHEVLQRKFAQARVRKTDWEQCDARAGDHGGHCGEEGFGSAIDMPGPWVLVLGSYRCPPTRGIDASRFELPRQLVT